MGGGEGAGCASILDREKMTSARENLENLLSQLRWHRRGNLKEPTAKIERQESANKGYSLVLCYVEKFICFLICLSKFLILISNYQQKERIELFEFQGISAFN